MDEKMIGAAKLTSKILHDVSMLIVPGATGLELDAYADRRCAELGVKAYNYQYHPEWAKYPFPNTLCVTINDMIAHGIPTAYRFMEGDTVSIDISIVFEGVCGDAAMTVPVGKIENKHERLLYYANRCLYAGIRCIAPGVSTEVITNAMYRYALDRGFKLNRRFSGHGIGERMHMSPKIYNVPDESNKYEILKSGQVICLEPMLTSGKDDEGFTGPDGWTTITTDAARSAFFEHMVQVTDTGYKVLTNHFEEVIP